MKRELKINKDEKEKLIELGRALSTSIRLDILGYLAEKPVIISDVATHFNIPLSSAALHIRKLESAGLISVQPIPGSKGAQKLCGVLVSKIDIDLYQETQPDGLQPLYREEVPIGSYFDYEVNAPCGIVSEAHYIGPEDTSNGFYSPARFTAQLIWLSQGYLEYRFTNNILKSNHANKIQFSVELCSEALGYNNAWRSDISIWMNGVEIGIIESPGDYGGRRGKLNPYWWNDGSTQYGDLQKIWITSDGCYINEKKVSPHTIQSLELSKQPYISFKIGIKPDAKYIGGMNIFGEKFGDYPQHIVMEVYNEVLP